MGDNIITLNYPFIDHQKEVVIETTLKSYLKNLNKANLFQQLSYILKEMIGNANKANLKRIHFIMNNLNINSQEDYKKGIQTFKEDSSVKAKKYSDEMEKQGHFVKIDLYTENNNFIMSVTNNSELTDIEKERINNKIKKANKFNSIEEALEEGLDTTEGAGLGLILTLLMLRKIGLDENVFKLIDEKTHTKSLVQIPLSLLNKEEEEFIADVVKKEIEEIPQFPEHILDLHKILDNPNANFDDLAHIINKDPALIADLLKVANSSMYMIPHKVKTIEEAVRQIGFKGVKNLILAYTAQKLLSDKYSMELIKDTINHSVEVAYYAYEFCKMYNYKDLLEETYTAAILHDFGKIIINSLKPDILEKIRRLCNEKGINSNIIENLTDGFNHSIIGARLAEKWNFPDTIYETIKYHHIPLEASDKNNNLVYIIYMSNIIYYYKRNEFFYDNINHQILKYFNLTVENEFKAIVDKIGKAYLARKANKDTN